MMGAGYRWAFLVLMALFGITVLASYQGWGLPSDTKVLARKGSVRTGSVHGRTFIGGGGFYGGGK